MEREANANQTGGSSRRATALKLILPPHAACLANEDRQAFYSLYQSLAAKFHPADETELTIVREIAEVQWKINRNKQIEAALFNRELLRQAARVVPSHPELRDLEVNLAAHEALTGNRTIAELRRDTQAGLRAISLLQRRLIQVQKHWPAGDPVPPTPAEEGKLHIVRPEPETPAPVLPVRGPATPKVADLYSDIFPAAPPTPVPKAA
jgi:hypothetical protein